MALIATVYLLVTALCLLVIAVAKYFSGRAQSITLEDRIGDLMPKAPGPRPLPVIGSLHLLGQYEVPFEGFTELSKIYGDVYSITLGSVPCIVVNSFKLIREVLIVKGAHFANRPDFVRYHRLFGGDRNNSLALCDWSSLQKTRRSIARMYCSPRFTSIQYDLVSSVGCAEMTNLLQELSNVPSGTEFQLKPLILAACANMFTQYMCSARFPYNDAGFCRMVRNYDEIFWEINQGYAVDFLPWLEPFYEKHMRKLGDWSHDVRQFIMSRIIEEHRNSLDLNMPARDLTDALLIHLEDDPNLNWEHIIFELEDFLGGHSAIGNLIMIMLAAVVRHPEVGNKIKQEIDIVTANGKRSVNLFDKASMPYTEATIWETLRTSSSPIVPHVSSMDTALGGFAIQKGTVIFINNYELNQGAEYWDEPKAFRPERFVSPDGKIIKPAHFIPFSTGKRTCIGQRLVQGFAFIALSTLLQHYDISSKDLSQIYTKKGCLAVPPDSYSLTLTARKKMQ